VVKHRTRIWTGTPFGFDRETGVPVAHDENGCAAIYGTSGAGKSVGTSMAEAFDEPGQRSHWYFDPKLEIAATAANHRRRILGKENVWIVNAKRMLAKERPDLASHGWNPAGHIHPDSEEFQGDCVALSNAAIMSDTHSDKHWAEGAREGIAGVMMAEAFDAAEQGRAPSLPRVRAIFAQEPEALQRCIREMMKRDHFGINTRVAKFLSDNKEIEGFKNTITVQTGWMTDDMCRDMERKGGVDFRQLRKRPTTALVGMPAHDMPPQYMRLAVSAALRACFATDGVPVTLFVDEAFILGQHADIEKALGILRFRDCRLNVVFQSMAQARQLYPATYGMFGSSAALCFAPADMETAEWMVKRCGSHWVPVWSVSEPGPNDPFPRRTVKLEKRDRIPLDKMFAMPKGTAIAFKSGEEGFHVVRVPGYFTIPHLAARADPNPYYEASRKRA
jgi:type IV secretory pathway TraG/TraD family ATPase VirD4